MDPHAEEVISGELVPGERLVWAGRPPLGLDIRKRDWVSALAFAAFTGLEVAGAFAQGGPFIFVTNALATLGICAHVFHRLYVVPFRRSRTYYAVTSERVLIKLVRGGAVELTAVAVTELDTVSLTEHTDGSGWINLGAVVVEVRRGPGTRPRHRLARFVYVELPREARQVFELIRDVQRAWLLGGMAIPVAGRSCGPTVHAYPASGWTD